MADPQKSGEPAINRENKASAMRWGIGLVVVLVLGVIVWLLSDPRGEPIDPTPPQQQTGEQPQSGINQPPAVVPDADSNTGTLDAPPPASSGAGTQ